MIITLTGLHGSGKSHLSGILKREFGWTYVNKRRVLEKLFGKHFPTPESVESIQWYRDVYQSVGAGELMSLVLSQIEADSNVVLDAVHNPIEWTVVKSSGKNVVLAGVFAPQEVRDARNTSLDAVLDRKRIGYWHDSQDSSLQCLMTKVDWAFSGVHGEELQIQECEALLSYLRTTGRLD